MMQQIFFIGFMTLIYIGTFIRKNIKRKGKLDFRKELIKLILVEYIFCVIAITLLPIYIRLGYKLRWSNTTINIIPFAFIREYWKLVRDDSYFIKIAVKNIIGNILLFMPIGILLPLLNDKFQNMKKIGLLSFAFSLTIEILQLLEMYFGMGLRMTDIDDLILNCCGGVIGFICYKVYIKIVGNGTIKQ